MKLLLINPNTTPAITDLVLTEARKVAATGTELIAATGRFGAHYLASRAACAIAAHAALDAFAEHGAGVDGVVLACFGDPGLAALKEIAEVPVVGLAEAAVLQACLLGARFSIVTGGERWRTMLEEFVAGLGLRERLASVRTVAPTGADIARDPEGSLALLAEACKAAAAEDRAEVVILGGAGLAGLAPRIAPAVPVPLIDGVVAGIKSAEAMVVQHPVKPSVGSFARTPQVGSVGLSPRLAALLAG